MLESLGWIAGRGWTAPVRNRQCYFATGFEHHLAVAILAGFLGVDLSVAVVVVREPVQECLG